MSKFQSTDVWYRNFGIKYNIVFTKYQWYQYLFCTSYARFCFCCFTSFVVNIVYVFFSHAYHHFLALGLRYPLQVLRFSDTYQRAESCTGLFVCYRNKWGSHDIATKLLKVTIISTHQPQKCRYSQLTNRKVTMINTHQPGEKWR